MKQPPTDGRVKNGEKADTATQVTLSVRYQFSFVTACVQCAVLVCAGLATVIWDLIATEMLVFRSKSSRNENE